MQVWDVSRVGGMRRLAGPKLGHLPGGRGLAEMTSGVPSRGWFALILSAGLAPEEHPGWLGGWESGCIDRL